MGSNLPETEAEFVAQLTRIQSTLELYLRGLMPGDRGVEEVVQQANAKIWQKRKDFEAGTNFRAWALAIARFEVLNYRKKQARDTRLTFSNELEQLITTDFRDRHDDQRDRRAALQECLQNLKPQARELLLARYAESEPLANVAARLGRSLGGVKVTLVRLRSDLLACIQRRLGAEGSLP